MTTHLVADTKTPRGDNFKGSSASICGHTKVRRAKCCLPSPGEAVPIVTRAKDGRRGRLQADEGTRDRRSIHGACGIVEEEPRLVLVEFVKDPRYVGSRFDQDNGGGRRGWGGERHTGPVGWVVELGYFLTVEELRVMTLDGGHLALEDTNTSTQVSRLVTLLVPEGCDAIVDSNETGVHGGANALVCVRQLRREVCRQAGQLACHGGCEAG